MDNLNCKMQAHARVCEENKLELEEQNDTYKNNFVITGVSLKGHIGRVGGGAYQDDILKDDSLYV